MKPARNPLPMVSRWALFKSLRSLHRLREQDPVEEELRGWNWDRPPLRPRAYLGLGVSEVAYRYCETRRDVFLKRMGVAGERTQPLVNGGLVHSVLEAAASDVKRELALGASGWEAYERLAAGLPGGSPGWASTPSSSLGCWTSTRGSR